MDGARGSAGKGMTGLMVATLLGLLGLVQSTYPAEFSCAAGDVTCLITAIQTANSNGESNTITLAAGLYTLTTVDNDTDGPTGLPSITSALTLRGPGAQSTVIERAPSAPRFRLLHVAATGTLALEGLTLRGGDLTSLSDGGGGLRNRGTLTIARSILSGHTATAGGGILNDGTLTIAHSTLRGNTASSNGGGIFQHSGNGLTLTNSTLSGNAATAGGGICSCGEFASSTVDNSTLSGNTASSVGGGIFLSTHTSVTLTNSTVGGNLATSGGGIHGSLGFTSVSAVFMQNTILAGNWVPLTEAGPDCSTGAFFSDGHNLIGDPTGCSILWAAGDLTGDPDFGAFTDNGTPGQGYVPLHPTSPAIDAGDTAACPPTDQLGQSRVGPCDIGAIEFQPEMVTIRRAVFADPLARLFVSATSSAPPDAALVATVPGCLANAPMHRLGDRYVLLRDVEACGNLNGQMVRVTSNYGGSASAPLR